MSNRNEISEIIWETQDSPEAEGRLLAAFEMLFKNVPIELPQDWPI
jgi:hypothetical protein